MSYIPLVNLFNYQEKYFRLTWNGIDIDRKRVQPRITGPPQVSFLSPPLRVGPSGDLVRGT